MTDNNSRLAKMLSRLEPGELSLDIFNQLARLTVMPVVEIVPFIQDEYGGLKVLLLKRSANDPLWANQYHVPGTIVLATDTPGSFSDAINRIVDSKLIDYEPTGTSFVDVQLCHVTRGAEVAIIFKTDLATIPDNSMLFDPSDLPDNMIEGQAEFVRVALKAYREA